MNTEQYLKKLKSGAKIKFSDFIELIDSEYHFSNIAFENGEIINSKFENQGSAKVFCFGHMHSLSDLEVLHCFAEHYESVLQTPENNSSHLNIRSFMVHGWKGLLIDFDALKIKS
jgi:hypothetical protein